MFGRFFGSKNKASSADDDLSQVQEGNTTISSGGSDSPTNDSSPTIQSDSTFSNQTKKAKSFNDDHLKKIERYDHVKIMSGMSIPVHSTRTPTIKKQEETTFGGETTFDEKPDSFIHVHIGNNYSDKASSVLPLVAHKVQCHVMYPLIQVVSTMTFRNTIQNRNIEGELVLPMPEGATMVGYAMEVNGKLIDAVPVEKEKAKEVFESEIRAGNKVSMVEKVAQSNCFRTRVYPLPYNQDKTVQVKYQLMLNEVIESQNENESGTVKGTAWFPVSYVDFQVLKEANIEFTLNETSLQGYDTNLSMRSAGVEEKTVWSSKNASKRAAYFNLTKTDLSEKLVGFGITITKQADCVNNILLAQENGYFMTSIPVPTLTQEMRNMARIGDNIQIIWDTSLGQSNSHAKNIQLFKSVLDNLKPKSIYFSTFSNAIIDQKKFSSNGDALKFAEQLIYDGGSNMLVFDQDLINTEFDYCIAFTNGVHTIGHEITPSCSFEKPIYFVNTSSIVNVNLLKHISTKSGGVYLNANELTQEEILNAIGKPVLSFVVADFEDGEMEEVYPNEPVSLKEGEIFKLFGKVKSCGKETTKVAVSFRYGSKIYHIQELDIPTGVNTVPEEAAILPTLWAQQKINSLSAFPQLFKDEIKKIGQDFRIVTDNTSLIVLETLSQYQKHDIIPPKSLTDVYNEFMKNKKSEQETKEKQEKEKLERIIRMWKERVNWHKTDFKLPEEKKEKKMSKKLAAMDDCYASEVSCSLQCNRDICCEERECCREECCRRCCAPCAPPSVSRSRCAVPSCSLSSSSSVGGGGNMPNAKREISSSVEESTPSVSGTIKVKAWTPDAAYCTAISSAKDPYQEYIKQRESYRDSPAFYLDVADYFLSSAKNREIGVRILTNIAELELENVQLYRIVGYRLDQAEELELAEWVFERVKSINGFEPQSYRDLALVKERMGKYEEAMELFNRVIVGKWDLRFDEIELTAATEMNHLLAKNPNLPIIDKRLIHHFDLDVRISMAWDTNDVDIDLHVKEPGTHGEHAYYGHNRTKMGGYVSRDFRHGYGPEEYMLKKAVKGTYKATTNYFANHAQNLTGGTTVLCTFFTNYMRPNEQRQMSTIRLSSHKQDIVVCEIDIA